MVCSEADYQSVNLRIVIQFLPGEQLLFAHRIVRTSVAWKPTSSQSFTLSHVGLTAAVVTDEYSCKMRNLYTSFMLLTLQLFQILFHLQSFFRQ
jgi:hypothetical protein